MPPPNVRCGCVEYAEQTAMSENETESPEPPQVDLADGANVRYWCERWNVTEAELQEAVARVGTGAPAVAFALDKEAY